MNIGGYINLGNLTADPASPQNGWIWYNSTLGKFRKRESGVTSDMDTAGPGALLYTAEQGLTTAQQLEARINAGIGIDSVFGRLERFSPTGSGGGKTLGISPNGAGYDEFGNNLYEVSIILNGLSGNANGSIFTDSDEFVIIIAKIQVNTSGFTYTENGTGIVLQNSGDYVVYAYNANGATLISTNIGASGGGLTNTQIQARARLA